MTDEKDKGFVLMYRKGLDHPLFEKDAQAWFIWSHLLMGAEWQERRRQISGHVVTLGRGQMAVSQRYLSAKTGISRQRIRTIFAKLVSERAIEISNPLSNPGINPAISIITVCNYDRYQSREEASNPDSNPDSNPASTQDQPRTNPKQKNRTIQQLEKEEEHTCAFAHFWDAFPDGRKRGRGDAQKRFERIVAKGDATAQELIEAVKAGNGIDPEYPPMPATWLNQSRWLDEPQGKKAISAKKQRSDQAKPEPAWMTIQRENGRRHARAMGVPEHEII